VPVEGKVMWGGPINLKKKKRSGWEMRHCGERAAPLACGKKTEKLLGGFCAVLLLRERGSSQGKFGGSKKIIPDVPGDPGKEGLPPWQKSSVWGKKGGVQIMERKKSIGFWVFSQEKGLFLVGTSEKKDKGVEGKTREKKKRTSPPVLKKEVVSKG